MTVQEAKELIMQVPLYRYECELERERQSDLFQALNMCVQALEEVEQYRALGTPTQILERIGGLDVELGKYHCLGTVEELKEAREFKKYFDELYGEGLEIANWHKNGDLEPFDSFYESALEWSEEDE